MATPALYACLWFDGQAEEAAAFYAALLPDSHVDRVWRSPADTPSGPAGTILTVDFTLAGQRFLGLNGGPDFRFNEAVSFVIECEDQAEVDRLWDALTADGGEPGPCGWLKDRYGLSWQIVREGVQRAARVGRHRWRAPRDGGDAPDGQARPRRAAHAYEGAA